MNNNKSLQAIMLFTLILAMFNTSTFAANKQKSTSHGFTSSSQLQSIVQHIHNEIVNFKKNLSLELDRKISNEKRLQQLIEQATLIIECIIRTGNAYPEVFIKNPHLIKSIESKSFMLKSLIDPVGLIDDLKNMSELFGLFEDKMSPLFDEPDTATATYKKILLAVTIASQTLLTLAVVSYIFFTMYTTKATKPNATTKQV